MAAPGENVRFSSIVAVRRMKPSDVPQISSILKESPEASNWPENSLLESALSGIAWVSEVEERVNGFLMGRSVVDEFEILNLAVAGLYRRRGIAKRLLETMAAWLHLSETRRAYLEVRASNKAALALYIGQGFKPCGRRVRYYQYPQEDAILLSWDKDGKQ
jgi:[ribosomal protein S18]-alanine N-acetyltransferase